MNLSKNNEWLWNSRWTHWWLKKAGPGAENESCMEPTFSGAIDDDEIERSAQALKRAGINTVLTEGLRHLVRFEHEGKTDQVIATIRKATQACHRAGIRIVHHTTTVFAGYRLTDFPVACREWLNIDARTGAPAFIEWRADWKGNGWYLWCINNPAFRAEYFRLCKKYLLETGVDGFMTDEVYFRTGWHNCVCPHCRDKFRKQTGFAPPSGKTKSFWGRFDNPAFRAWIGFRTASVGDFYADLYAALRKTRFHPVLLGCHNGAESPGNPQCYGDSNEERMRGLKMLFEETGGTAVLYSWRRMAADYMLHNGLSNYYGTPTLAIAYHPNSNELFVNWALRVVHGIRVWATSGGGALARRQQLLTTPKDLASFGQLFGWEEKYKKVLAGAIRPVANIGVLLSAATRDMSDHQGGWNYYVRELVGWCEALTDENLQYAVITDADLTVSRLRQYELVILPNAACLNDAALRDVGKYTAKGGSVIWTHETGFKDETGSPRPGKRRLAKLVRMEGETAAGGMSWPEQRRQAVRFGKYGLGKYAYFAHKPGLAVYTTTNLSGKHRARDTDDIPAVTVDDQDLQRSLMIGAVRWAAANRFPLTIKQAPTGILVKAFHRKNNNRPAMVIHLLNLRGESVKFGESIPSNYPEKYPPLDKDIVLDLRQTSLKQAYLISPDWPGRKTVKVERCKDGFRITIPARALKQYAALWVS